MMRRSLMAHTARPEYFSPAQISAAKKFLDREYDLQGGFSIGAARELLRARFSDICPSYTSAFDLAEAVVGYKAVQK